MSMRPATATCSTAVMVLTAAVLTAGPATAAVLTTGPATAAHINAAHATAARAAKSAAPDFAALVNPLIGTGGHGNTFPGADTPFGMLQWSPDTTNRAKGGGYAAGSSQITGFSLTHMSGPGCRAAGDVPVLPTVGSVRPGARDSFRQSREAARAGYYAVRLDNGIRVDLTATTRTGMAEFSFPAGRRGNLIFKLNGSQNGDSAVTFRRDNPTTVQGSVTSRNFSCGDDKNYTLYFEMRFSRPASRHGTFTSAAAASARPGAVRLSATGRGPLQTPATVPADAASAGSQLAYHGTLPRGAGLRPNLRGTVGAYVSFSPGQPVLAKVGISYVSAAGAAANLAAEDRGWSFAAIQTAAQRQWNALLAKIAVTGGSERQRVVFYTALYHALLSPSVFSDDNGAYVGANGRVHRVDHGQTAEYTNFSGWDIYRTQAQLEALLDPAAASGAAQSLLDAYRQTKILPRWAAYGRNTFVMVGDPADSTIADYYAFGATGFEATAALSAMITQASRPGDARPGLNYLISLGYLPQDGSYGCCNYYASVSTTLEYDTADFAISALAGALGHAAEQRQFRRRAHDWRNLLNASSGLMQPRLADGSWNPGFSPTATTGFAEGDALQYTGMVPFDVGGLAAAKGGSAAMARYLNQVLARFLSNSHGATANMANEPSIELPWEYDYIGEPYRTERTVRSMQTQLWRDATGGIPGNDDLGAMSAWFVWSALGMYPMTPGTATLALGSPLFRRAVISLPTGRDLIIIGTGARTDAPYIRSASWNGASWNRAYAPATAITSGGTLNFRLGSRPARSWAAKPADAPPSYSP